MPPTLFHSGFLYLSLFHFLSHSVSLSLSSALSPFCLSFGQSLSLSCFVSVSLPLSVTVSFLRPLSVSLSLSLSISRLSIWLFPSLSLSCFCLRLSVSATTRSVKNCTRSNDRVRDEEGKSEVVLWWSGSCTDYFCLYDRKFPVWCDYLGPVKSNLFFFSLLSDVFPLVPLLDCSPSERPLVSFCRCYAYFKDQIPLPDVIVICFQRHRQALE